MCGAEGLRVRRGMIDALCSLEEEGEKETKGPEAGTDYCREER